jgi:hypothetical protein
LSQNALDPNLMTAAERLAELSEILAAGLLRLRAREREPSYGHSPEANDPPHPRKQPRRQRGAA